MATVQFYGDTIPNTIPPIHTIPPFFYGTYSIPLVYSAPPPTQEGPTTYPLFATLPPQHRITLALVLLYTSLTPVDIDSLYLKRINLLSKQREAWYLKVLRELPAAEQFDLKQPNAKRFLKDLIRASNLYY